MNLLFIFVLMFFDDLFVERNEKEGFIFTFDTVNNFFSDFKIEKS